MPNWCENRVDFYGEPEALAEIFNGQPFNFNRFIPEPEGAADILVGSNVIDGERVSRWKLDEAGKPRKLTPEEEALPNWYDWRIEHWGVKWDIEPPHPDGTVEDGHIQLRFDTPWGPPTEFCYKLREMFPEVTIGWFYDEPGMQIAGYIK